MRATTSPVRNQPSSSKLSAVASGLRQYSRNRVSPFSRNSPLPVNDDEEVHKLFFIFLVILSGARFAYIRFLLVHWQHRIIIMAIACLFHLTLPQCSQLGRRAEMILGFRCTAACVAA